jgi:hypothetical protein
MTGIPDYRPLELMLDPKMTKVEFDDFIGVWPNFMPKPLCETIINYADKISDTGCTVNYDKESKDQQYLDDKETVYKSEEFYDGALNRQDFAFLLNYANRELVIQINQVLKSCANHYINKYQALRKQPLMSTDIKVQRTPPGGGYHLWHHENADIAHANRELVWMIYLNDMPDGEAETEFLYQRRRIKPTAGTVVIWPGGFTHTHKGNTVMTQDKYIVTGWYIKGK